MQENDLENNAIDVWEQGERGNLNIILVVLAQLLMFPFTYLCISRIRSSAWQWFNLWNMIDMVTQCMQVVCTVVYLCGAHPRGFDIMLGTQVVLLIAKIQFYARSRFGDQSIIQNGSVICSAFVAVDSSMLDTLKAVVGSIRWYLLLLILTVYSFACALFILFRKRLSECEVSARQMLFCVQRSLASGFCQSDSQHHVNVLFDAGRARSCKLLL